MRPALSGLLLLVVLTARAISSVDPWRELWSNPKLDESVKIVGGTEIVPESDLSDPERRIWIITTACLPWLTGTSVNPLLRAAYLAKERPKGKITLMVPWLQMEEQDIAFPPGVRFTQPEEQREYVKKWLIEDAQLPLAAEKLEIQFYSARYHDEYHSIFPMGDVSALIPDEEADVCVLEEPEHLNWYDHDIFDYWGGVCSVLRWRAPQSRHPHTPLLHHATRCYTIRFCPGIEHHLPPMLR